MTLESVIDSLNKFVKDDISKDYFFVLQREIVSNKLAKVYKELTITLWKVYRKSLNKEKVLTLKKVNRVTENEIDTFVDTSEKEFLIELFDYVQRIK